MFIDVSQPWAMAVEARGEKCEKATEIMDQKGLAKRMTGRQGGGGEVGREETEQQERDVL